MSAYQCEQGFWEGHGLTGCGKSRSGYRFWVAQRFQRCDNRFALNGGLAAEGIRIGTIDSKPESELDSLSNSPRSLRHLCLSLLVRKHMRPPIQLFQPFSHFLPAR